MKKIFSLIVVCLLTVPSSMIAADDAPEQERFVVVSDGYKKQVTCAWMFPAIFGHAVGGMFLKGVDVNAQDNDGRTALDLAQHNGNSASIELPEGQ